MALLEKAAGQGHTYAMFALGDIHGTRKEYEQAVAWYTQGAEAGLPKAMFSLGTLPDQGHGVAAPDYPAAAGWYRRAAEAGSGPAANNLCTMYTVGSPADNTCLVVLRIVDPRFSSLAASRDVANIICQALGRGVTRSKRRAMQWMRKAVENGDVMSCLYLAMRMYEDRPYAREVGHVGEAAEVTTPVGVMEGHDVPPDVLTSVVHWLRKGGYNTVDAVVGAMFCYNEGCEVVGQLKDFKVCPQCKTARYCATRVRN